MGIITKCFQCKKGNLRTLKEVEEKNKVIELICEKCGIVFEIPKEEKENEK